MRPETSSVSRPRVLIVEPSTGSIDEIATALGRHCFRGVELDTRPVTKCVCPAPCYAAVGGLRELHKCDLDGLDLALCAVGLPDGSGLDALAYLRGSRPDLPVILMGAGDDAMLATESIRSGAMDFLITDGHYLRTLPMVVEKCLEHQRIREENERLHRELSRSLAKIELKNREFEEVIRQLETTARTDELTSLANRRWLNLMLEGSWAEAMRHDLPLAFLMIDLDGFKSLNDRMGHQRGDEILRLAGKVIRANCREIDVSARYGGDEFCVLMPHTEPHQALLVADRMLREFDGAMRKLPSNHPRVGMTIGLAHVHLSRPTNANQLVTHADEALYAGKSTGKNRVMARGDDGVFVPMRDGVLN